MGGLADKRLDIGLRVDGVTEADVCSGESMKRDSDESGLELATASASKLSMSTSLKTLTFFKDRNN